MNQAMVLKMVRTISALASLQLLVEAGLVLDAGATMRTLDELGSDLMFLAGPARTGEIEPKHRQYLAEFFQEEFDHIDPLLATQSRKRVSRRDIRAYVARVYADMAKTSVSQMSAIFETVESSVSGYVHGASTHILDVYDGSRFVVPTPRGASPSLVTERLVASYLFRAFVPAIVVAMAMHLTDVTRQLHQGAGEIERLLV